MDPDSSSSSTADILRYLQQDWGVLNGPDELKQANQQFLKHSVTDIVVTHFSEVQKKSFREPPPTSLNDLVIGKIIEVLKVAKESGSLHEEILLLIPQLSENVLIKLLEDCRLPYLILRAILKECERPDAPPMVDVDEMVLKHDRLLQSRHPSQLVGSELLTLEDLMPLSEQAEDGCLSFTRKTPPKGGMEMLDYRRSHKIAIPLRDFATTFERATGGILRGLNHCNVIVTGEPLVDILLHADKPQEQIGPPFIVLNLWGLNPSEALDKTRQIHATWVSNVSTLIPHQWWCIKTRECISLVSDGSLPTVKIKLSLFQNPTHVLLDYQPDIYAIGFDGVKCYMLPRCARALETGYNIFTSAHLRELGPSAYCNPLNIVPMVRAAEIGFGLRILESYVNSLRERIEVPRTESDGQTVNSYFRQHAHLREPGLLTLKRKYHLSQNWVLHLLGSCLCLRRFCDRVKETDSAKWEAAYQDAVKDNGSLPNAADLPDAEWNQYTSLTSHLDCVGLIHDEVTVNESMDLPAYARLGCFEGFARQCEFARVIADATVAGITKSWRREAHHDNESEIIWDDRDESMFEILKRFICYHLNVPYHDDGWRGYLTRRIRCYVDGDNIETLFNKQIVQPLIIPHRLEQYLNTMLDEIRTDTNANIPNPLIDIHKPGRDRGVFPSYVEPNTDSKGNLRYWAIPCETMFAGIDPRLDEIYALLDAFTEVFTMYDDGAKGHALEADINHSDFFKSSLGLILRQRAAPPELANWIPSPGDDVGLVMSTGAAVPVYPHTALTAKDALKFGLWVSDGPDIPVHVDHHGNPKYPFPDSLFWGSEDEKMTDRDRTWTEWSMRAPRG